MDLATVLNMLTFMEFLAICTPLSCYGRQPGPVSRANPCLAKAANHILSQGLVLLEPPTGSRFKGLTAVLLRPLTISRFKGLTLVLLRPPTISRLKGLTPGGCSLESWRPIREGENTLIGLFFVKNARNVRYAFRGSK